MSYEGKLFICELCKATNGKKDVITRRSRCFLCGGRNSSFDLRTMFGKGHKGKDDVKRYPRLVNASSDQKGIIELVNNICRDFDCPGKVEDVVVGPVVTIYKFKLDRYSRIKKLKSLAEDLAIALKVDSVSMARIPQESAVGIFIPNPTRQVITFNETLKNVIAHRHDMQLPINFGVRSTGEPFIEDLTLLPHLLVAGSTGAGKSVFLRTVIDSLLYIRSPKELKFVMSDPKQVELFRYESLPHMFTRPESDVWGTLRVMETVIAEMERRMNNLHGFGCRDIKEYNDRVKAEAKALTDGGQKDAGEKRGADIWPYLVVIIDEMADLVMQEKKEVTERLAKLSAMGRASGIHLICATQRPSVDVLRGTIKNNFPARVAFRVPQSQDSKTILAQRGAETLLGKGDMFYMTPNYPGLQRLHSPFTTVEDTEHMKKLSVEVGHYLKLPADAVTESASKSASAEAPKAAKKAAKAGK